MEFRRLDAPFGAEVAGVDLARELDAADADRIRAALCEHSVLLFRAQKITPADQVRFSAQMGPLRVPLNDQYAVPGYAGLHLVSNIRKDGRPIGLPDAGVYRHSDGAYMEKPDFCTMLYAIEVPRDDIGRPLGATEFASTALAYDALDEAMKARLAPLRVVNTVHMQYIRKMKEGILQRDVLTPDQKRNAPEREHPLIRTHPVTGGKCIFASEGHTARVAGLPEAESDALLAELHRHVTRPEFRYAHRWTEGDFLLWDNISTQHNATFDYRLPQRRLMQRTSCVGTVPC